MTNSSTRHTLWTLAAGVLFAASVVGQGTGTGNTGTGNTTGNTTTITLPGILGGNAVGATNNASQPCVPNSSAQPGAIFLLSPNTNNVQTSAGVVGGKLNITWAYDRNTMIPNTIAIYYAEMPASNALVVASAPTPATYYSNIPIAQNLPGSATYYIWPITGLTPGNYLLRIVGDGIDLPYYTQQHPGQVQCYKANQAFPGQSQAAFAIAGNSQLVGFPDNFGPVSWGTTTAQKGTGLAVFVVGVLSLFIL
ncbi:UNVERIFIED_CONTAM: hypothetical protein HDU68_011247 [Siphonaria sp. JEL0065]|nr:hypothetical protein HDU68_011247 [Siphonaria sp. JEL0065]